MSEYKDTIFLPRTEFPMRAGLAKKEPEILKRWADMDLYGRLRAESAGREKFILHDGPPYANGHLHIGHALNKILKDVINRAQQMMGRDAPYVPGWDCHGLPIEWKVEEGYRKAGKNKDEVPIVEFRQECREFAEKWIAVQSEEFQRLGVCGDWQNPYTTMTPDAEATIVAEMGRFLMNGGLYRGAKPVLWSVVEKTALAEAEVEYQDHTSTTIHVRFPVIRTDRPDLEGAAVVIWTTTPWTIPGNRAVAYGAEADYVLVRVDGVGDDSLARVGEKLVLARPLLAQVQAEAGITAVSELAWFKGRDLAGTAVAHPFRGQGYDFDDPLLAADFVTMDTGTGFVHIAPGHGADDWVLGRAHDLEVPATVDEEGRYYDHVPLFAGKVVFTQKGKGGDANPAVVAALKEAGALLASGRVTHSYPHSWRSKAPLIFRTTAQWFISMSHNDLRAKALAAIDNTRFHPDAGRRRLHAMVEARPDWCISRQRAWGVPIPVFVHKATGELLRDPHVMERIVDAVRAEGADVWFTAPASRFLGNEHDPAEYEQVRDIVDVWFESGATHAFVLEQRPELAWPADLYLEGSDQHRGWFHSSLLESCGTRDRAPYDAVLTHGFVMDEKGFKMSKSLGNVVSPQDVVKQHGADILRLWVVVSDYSEDLRIGPDILKSLADLYRRLRNTLRYLLGNLAGFDPAERLPVDQMPELERWVLHRLWSLDRMYRAAIESNAWHGVFTELHNFCAVELSAFYFDIRKDSLYCDRADDLRRRAARTVMDLLFDHLTAWLAPVLCFTAEEAWLARGTGAEDSVHLRRMPAADPAWQNTALGEKWRLVRALRRVVTGALEKERAARNIGASLEAHPTVFALPEYLAAMDGVDLAEIAITSAADLVEGEPPTELAERAYTLDDVPGVWVLPGRAEGSKCARCWQVLPGVGAATDLPDLCPRCADAVRAARGAAA